MASKAMELSDRKIAYLLELVQERQEKSYSILGQHLMEDLQKTYDELTKTAKGYEKKRIDRIGCYYIHTFCDPDDTFLHNSRIVRYIFTDDHNTYECSECGKEF